MSYLRRLALKISNTVVTYASPGSKEWAEALAREVAFVESDWAALVWALGSVRVLFRYRPIGSFADLSSLAQKVTETKRDHPNGTWMAAFVWFFIFAGKFCVARSWTERAGCSLVAAGFLNFGIFVLVENRRTVPPSDDIIALILSYKAALERFRRSSGWWMMGSVTFLCLGQMLAARDGFRAHPYWNAIYGLAWAGAMLWFLLMRQANRRRLEQIDVLLAEKA
jgi:hypothetical protein